MPVSETEKISRRLVTSLRRKGRSTKRQLNQASPSATTDSTIMSVKLGASVARIRAKAKSGWCQR